MTDEARTDDKQGNRPPAGQWAIALLVVLALVASGLMVFRDDLSMTGSLAVIAALWAAVIGAVLVTKYRRQADVAEARTRDLRLVYELQLEREISARRQYETDVEASIREELAGESNRELDELKAQVLALRSSLEQLLGEPLPAPRIALGLDRPRELGSGLAGVSYSHAADDRAAAERDFASTAPPVEAGRHAPADNDQAVPPRMEDAQLDDAQGSDMTEIIPIVTDDPVSLDEINRDAEHEPESGPVGHPGPFTHSGPFAQPGPFVQPEPPVGSGRFPQPPPVPNFPPRQPAPAQRAPFGAGAYRPPADFQQAPSGPQPVAPATPAAQAPEVRESQSAPEPVADGAHTAGRPASELLFRLREEAARSGDAQSPGGRRRRN